MTRLSRESLLCASGAGRFLEAARSMFVIRTFAHKGLEALFRTGSKAGVQPSHASRLRRQLAQLDAATWPRDMGLPGWGLHALKGELAGMGRSG